MVKRRGRYGFKTLVDYSDYMEAIFSHHYSRWEVTCEVAQGNMVKRQGWHSYKTLFDRVFIISRLLILLKPFSHIIIHAGT